jgi:hypothetical protein
MLFNSRIRIALVTAGFCALVAVGVAGADTRTISDGNRTRGPLDIRFAQASHDSRGRLLHTIQTERRIPRTSHSTYCVLMWFHRHNANTVAPDRGVCINGNHTRGTVFKKNGTRAGSARAFVGGRNNRFWVIRFSRHVVRGRTYFWQVRTFRATSSDGCRGGCVDRAPNDGHTIRHGLRRSSGPRFTG